jgi:hypothetical protein
VTEKKSPEPSLNPDAANKILKDAYKGKSIKEIRPELRGEAARIEIRARQHGLTSGAVPSEFAKQPVRLLANMAVCLAQVEQLANKPSKLTEEESVVMHAALDEAALAIALFRGAFSWYDENGRGPQLEVVESGKIITP